MLKNFEKLALRTKLIIGFTIVLILMASISAISFSQQAASQLAQIAGELQSLVMKFKV